MAEQKKTARALTDILKDLKQDEIIGRLVPDPANPPDVIMMVGFLGKSARSKFWRLYQTLDLKCYVEIAEDDIVLSQSLKTDLQPLGGTAIWAKSSARLQHTQSDSRLAETEFMQGDITRKFLAGMGPEGLLRGRGGVGGVFRQNTYYPCTLYHCYWGVSRDRHLCNSLD